MIDIILKKLKKYAALIFILGIIIVYYITESNSDYIINSNTSYKPIIQNREQKIKELVNFYEKQDISVKPTRSELQEVLNLYNNDISKIADRLKNQYGTAPESWLHNDFNTWNNYRKMGEGIVFIFILIFGIYNLPNSIINKKFSNGIIVFILLISLGFVIDYITINYSLMNLIIYLIIILGLIFILKYNKTNLHLAYIYLKLELQQIKLSHLFILLLLLVIFILMLFGLPTNNLYFWFYLPKYYIIQKEPIYLNYETVFNTQTKKIIQENNTNNNNIIDTFNYNYCISGWITINPQPPSYKGVYNQYIPLINFNNKPSIYYKASENHLKIIMNQVTDKDQNKSILIYQSNNLALQKWNHFCFNYQNNNIDIFINNKLVATKTNIIPWMTQDNIVAGKKNGIEGGFRNIFYFSQPLTKSQIKYLYDYQK